jgi:hypothetical protein
VIKKTSKGSQNVRVGAGTGAVIWIYGSAAVLLPVHFYFTFILKDPTSSKISGCPTGKQKTGFERHSFLRQIAAEGNIRQQIRRLRMDHLGQATRHGDKQEEILPLMSCHPPLTNFSCFRQGE